MSNIACVCKANLEVYGQAYIVVQVTHIEGRENHVADILSRVQNSREAYNTMHALVKQEGATLIDIEVWL